MVFLQGGPSHIDIWDPKPDAPANIRGDFKPIQTKIPGTHIGEHMPMMAKALDKATLIRSMSYTPNGLFNHTAAIYQMLTGYPPDRVSPSGQLEPPTPADFPTAGSHVSKLKPPKEAVLPFVELPRPLQESGVIGKGGAAGFLGKAYDPYRLYQDPAKPIKTEDLSLRKEIPPERLKDRFELLEGHQRFHARSGEGAQELRDRRILRQGIRPGAVRQGARCFRPHEGARQNARALRHDDVRAGPAALAPPDRGRHALRADELAGGGQRQSRSGFLGHARRQLRPAEEPALPEARPRPLGAAGGHGRRGMLKETLVVAIGEFGRSPRIGVSAPPATRNAPDGRDHWPYCYSGVVAGCGIARGAQYGESDQTASSPKDKPVHPNDLLATVYYALGIDPDMVGARIT